MTAPTFFAKLAGEGVGYRQASVGRHGRRSRHSRQTSLLCELREYVVGTGLTNVFPTRPELNWSAKEGLNGRNYMIRVDHQLNANNTYTARYLTERQPNRDLLTGDRATPQHGQLRARYRSDRQRGVQPRHWDAGAEHDQSIDRDRGHSAWAEPGTSLKPIARIWNPVLRFLSF